MSDDNEVQPFEGVRIHRGNAEPESEVLIVPKYGLRVIDVPMLTEAEMEIADARMRLVDLDGAISLCDECAELDSRTEQSRIAWDLDRTSLEAARRELRERLALHRRRK